MFRRRLLALVFAFCFISCTLCVQASAANSVVSGNLIGTDWIVSTPNSYLTTAVQFGSDSKGSTFGYHQTVNFHSYIPSTSPTPYPMVTATSSDNPYVWVNSNGAPFPSTYDGQTCIVYPRFSSSAGFPSTSSPVPFSVVYTVIPPLTEYRGLSINFSKIQPSLDVRLELKDSFRSVVSDCYVSIVINGKTWSTLRFDSTVGLDTRVTLDVTQKDTVSVVFSLYPPTAASLVYSSRDMRAFYLFSMNGIYSKPAFPVTASPYSYPLQWCYYNLDNTPSFDDGFEGGIPGDGGVGGGGDGGGGGSGTDLSEVLAGLDKIGTSLDEYQARVEEIATDVSKGLDKVDQTIKDSTNTIMGSDDPEKPTGIKGIISSILNLPKAILDGFIGLFIPSQEQMEQIKASYDELLTEKFGLGYQAVELIDTLFTSVSNNLTSSSPYSFTFPGISFPMNGGTVTILDETEVSLDNAVMDVLRPVAGTAVTIVSVLAFVNMLKSFIESLLSGKGISDFNGSD